MTSSRAGFTLLELMIALAIGSLVLLTARAMLMQAVDSAERIAGLAGDSARELNGELWLRNILLQVNPHAASEPLIGHDRRMEFWSWCETARGWAEECRIRLEALQPTGLEARVNEGPHLRILDALPIEQFLYLFSSGEAPIGWRTDWLDSDIPPSAVGLVTFDDTVIMRIGTGR